MTAEETLDAELAWLLDEVVDDLARYGLVAFVYSSGGYRGELEALAEHIGVRSGPRLERALRALGAAGVVAIEQLAGGGVALRPSCRADHRELVAKLLALPAHSRSFALAMRRLTTRSLSRAIGISAGERASEVLPDVARLP